MPDHDFVADFADGLNVDVIQVNMVKLVSHFLDVDFIFGFQLNQNAAGEVNAVIKAFKGDAGNGQNKHADRQHISQFAGAHKINGRIFGYPTENFHHF